MGMAPDSPARPRTTWTRILAQQWATAFKTRHGYAPTASEIAEAIQMPYDRVLDACKTLPVGMVSYSGRQKARTS